MNSSLYFLKALSSVSYHFTHDQSRHSDHSFTLPFNLKFLTTSFASFPNPILNLILCCGEPNSIYPLFYTAKHRYNPIIRPVPHRLWVIWQNIERQLPLRSRIMNYGSCPTIPPVAVTNIYIKSDRGGQIEVSTERCPCAWENRKVNVSFAQVIDGSTFCR